MIVSFFLLVFMKVLSLKLLNTELAERIRQEYLQYPDELDVYQIFVKASIGITYRVINN